MMLLQKVTIQFIFIFADVQADSTGRKNRYTPGWHHL